MAKQGSYKIVLDFTYFIETMKKVGVSFSQLSYKLKRMHYVSEGVAPAPFVGSVDI